MGRRSVPTLDELIKDEQGLFDVLNEEDDIACVLIASAYLDQALRLLLEKRHRDCEQTVRPLSTRNAATDFNSRIDAAFNWGLIPKGLRDNLHVVRDMRNDLAHSHRLHGFDDALLRERCSTLSYPHAERAFVIGFPEGEEPVDIFPRNAGPRERFTLVTILMVSRILVTALSTGSIPQPARGW